MMKTLAYVLAAFGVVLATADAANYYVNDGSTAGDVYCTAVGSESNTGTSPSSPKAHIQRILDLYDLGGGDMVYVDTGTYYPTNYGSPAGPGVSFLSEDRGSIGSYVTVQGSTNDAAGGSLFIRGGSSYPAFHSWSSGWIRIRNMRLTEGEHGFNGRMVSNLVFEGCAFHDNYGDGALIRECNDVWFDHCRFFHNRGRGLTLWGGVTRVFINHGSVWSNNYASSGGPLAEIYYDDGADLLSMSNTVVLARGTGHVCLHMDWFEPMPYVGDYNDLCATDNAFVGGYGISVAYRTLAEWQAGIGQDAHSIGRDPHPTADGHLMSRGGTWSNGAWAVCATNSPCIDAGSPASPFADEPAPNGGRVNIGAFGNTVQASRTADWDGDGLSDNSECYEYGTNPDSDDTDGDGYNDRSELIAGTTATDEESFFSTEGLVITNGTVRGFELAWYGVSGRAYQPQWRTNLVNGANWSNCTGLVTPSGQAVNLNGANASVTAVDTNADGKTVRFYRVRVTKQ